MMSFSAKMLAPVAFLLASNVDAALPRHCFIAATMHGLEDSGDADRMSDLPTLMAKYEPGMTLSRVTAYHEDDSYLMGLKAQL